jgi:hypothetical protein
LKEKDTQSALSALAQLELRRDVDDGIDNNNDNSKRGGSVMAELMRREDGEEETAVAEAGADSLQAIIDAQLEKGAPPPPPTTATAAKLAASQPDNNEDNDANNEDIEASLSPEMRLLLSALYGKVLNVYRATARSGGEACALIRQMRAKGLTVDAAMAHSLMDVEIKARNFQGALRLYDLFFPAMSPLEVGRVGPVRERTFIMNGDYNSKRGNDGDDSDDGNASQLSMLAAGGGITQECPELKAIVAMARALTRMVYPDSNSIGDGKEHEQSASSEPDSASRGLAESAMGYVLNVIHHFPALTRQTRSLSSLYGVVSRLARLATEAGRLEATLALYTFIPLKDRRLAPWTIIAKQMADCPAPAGKPAYMRGRAELSLLLMRGEGQRGDQSGGMSPLALINAVTKASNRDISSGGRGRGGWGEESDEGPGSILYDPYVFCSIILPFFLVCDVSLSLAHLLLPVCIL